MAALLAKIIWRNKIRILAFVLICVVFVWVYASFFPAVQSKAEEFNRLLSAYPESLIKAFGLENQNMFTSFSAFLAIEHFSLVWPIILIILVITYASSAIAGEIEQGTIEILLSQPLSRTRLYLAKYLAGLIMVALFIILTNFSIIPLAQAYNLKIDLHNLFILSLLGLIFGLAIYGLAFLFSSIFSNRSHPTFLTTGIILVMYVLNLVATLKESTENLKYFSYFYYFDYTKALLDGQIDTLAIWVLAGSVVVFFLTGWIYFLKRDISV